MLGQRFIFNYNIQHYLSFTLKLHETYVGTTVHIKRDKWLLSGV